MIIIVGTNPKKICFHILGRKTELYIISKRFGLVTAVELKIVVPLVEYFRRFKIKHCTRKKQADIRKDFRFIFIKSF